MRVKKNPRCSLSLTHYPEKIHWVYSSLQNQDSFSAGRTERALVQRQYHPVHAGRIRLRAAIAGSHGKAAQVAA